MNTKITVLNNSKAELDDTPPMVNITNPSYPPTVTTGKIIIQGTAYDFDSGIRKVYATATHFPLSSQSRNNPASSSTIPISPNNWSRWSFPLVINKTGTYMVLIEAIDNAGNRNYAHTIINTPFRENNNSQIQDLARTPLQTIPKIAFVRPTFTEATYQEHDVYFACGLV